MNKKEITISLVVLALTLGGMYWWFTFSLPTQAEVSQATLPVQAVDQNFLQKTTTQNILKRDLNGNVPVVVDSNEMGREDPFANF